MKLVTLECAGILPSSTANETITHITNAWARGKTIINMLREQLGPDLRDLHCPLRNGGVEIHKIFGLMHDTCNTANRVADLMGSLRDDCGRLYYGEETWDAEGNKVPLSAPNIDTLTLTLYPSHIMITRQKQRSISFVKITHVTFWLEGLPNPNPVPYPICFNPAP